MTDCKLDAFQQKIDKDPEFKDWIISMLLSINKTGSYSFDDENNTKELMIKKKLSELRQK
jgi:hypothetical protein